MKITKEELTQIIREELNKVLDESVFGPKVGRKLSSTKYDYDKKDKPKQPKDYSRKKGQYDDIDLDKIHQDIAKKFGGKYKKLKEEEDTEDEE